VSRNGKKEMDELRGSQKMGETDMVGDPWVGRGERALTLKGQGWGRGDVNERSNGRNLLLLGGISQKHTKGIQNVG